MRTTVVYYVAGWASWGHDVHVLYVEWGVDEVGDTCPMSYLHVVRARGA